MDIGSLLAGSVAAIALVLAYQYFNTYKFWSSRGIKGPTPWPLLGTSGYYLFKKKIDQDREWHEKYGKTFGLYEGSDPVLRTVDNEIIKQVNIKEFSSFTDRNNKLIVGESMRRWLLWSSGKLWANQRAIITPLFTSSNLRSMFGPLVGCADRYIAITKSAMNSKKDDEPKKEELVLSRDELMSLTLDVIATTFFGLKLDTYRDKTSEFFKRAFAFASFNVPRFFLWLCTPTFVAKYLKFDLTEDSKFEYFDKLSQQLISNRRRSKASGGQAPNKVDIIGSLLEAQLPEEHVNVHTPEDNLSSHYNDLIDHNELDRIHREQSKTVKFRWLDDADIRGQMTFFFLAGFETTSGSLSFCLYELGHQQEAQAEVYAELVEKLGPRGELLDYNQLMELKKLDAFISETLRLFSPVAEHNRKVTNKSGAKVNIDGRHIIHLPPGTVVSVSPQVLQRHPDYWEEPDKFNMSRFYIENRDKMKSCTYVPFGVGPRNCVGMRFALMNMKCLLSKVLLNYQVKPGPNNQQYPPTFKRHAFFNQIQHTDFTLVHRHQMDLY